MKERPKHRRRSGITWKLFVMLMLFMITMLIVIWLFQVRLLNVFYLSSKFMEMRETGRTISDTLSWETDTDLEAELEDIASKNYSIIRVYRVIDQRAELVAKAESIRNDRLPKLNEQDVANLYQGAKDTSGEYAGTVYIDVQVDRRSHKIAGGNVNDAVSASIKQINNGAVGVVSAKLVSFDEGEFLILQMESISPVAATVRMLQTQFLWIGVLLLILTAVFAVILTKLITKPIVRINQAAKGLSHGHYDVNSVTGGYREIDELSDTLNYASSELSRSVALQKELISNVSHDLRTPLTMIKGYSEVMRDIPEENTAENMQVIIDETTRLSELVNDMLDISKLQAGTRKPNYSDFCITQIIRETLTRYDKLVDRDGYSIEFSADEDVTICADQGMILQVIYNLINNAINYTGEDKRVTVRQSLNGMRVRISVMDTGEGIENDQLPLIWERYYKVDKVHKRATVGTGLGLSIVKEILELHSAVYGVNSTVGEGSEFWFEMPVIKEYEEDVLRGEYEN